MNIFVFSTDTYQCATEHCKSHLTKMILEYAQLMSTAHYVYGSWTDVLPKQTHVNHPCAIWVRECSSNYYWLYSLFCQCLNEFHFRRGKTHAYERLVAPLSNLPPDIPISSRTRFALAMPDEFKSDDPEWSYQMYFSDMKRHLANWECRPVPVWFN